MIYFIAVGFKALVFQLTQTSSTHEASATCTSSVTSRCRCVLNAHDVKHIGNVWRHWKMFLLFLGAAWHEDRGDSRQPDVGVHLGASRRVAARSQFRPIAVVVTIKCDVSAERFFARPLRGDAIFVQTHLRSSRKHTQVRTERARKLTAAAYMTSSMPRWRHSLRL